MLYDQNEHYISCKCFFENMSDINVNTHKKKSCLCVLDHLFIFAGLLASINVNIRNVLQTS